ncbi:MAG: hypothetical protein EOO11_19405 [Chitinophagaceae bacterium]|nr:MAG: hypothetical protein EOO11_19405 [Chitinophagaceae bacterium]
MRIVRNLCALLLVAFSFLSFTPVPPADPIVNTTWGGTDSDGDNYEFYFHPDGHVRYKSNGSSYDSKEDIWSQNGNTVIIVLTRYSTYLSTIRGNTMEGQAWNRKDRSWTFTWRKKGLDDIRPIDSDAKIRPTGGRK